MSFNFPKIYSMPPFFTIQPVEKSRDKQIHAWCELILDYCRKNKIYTIDVNEALKTDLFSNKKIKRSLKKSDVQFILDQLISRGNGSWEGKTKERCSIIWRTAQQWADVIYNWALRTGMTDQISTVFEMQNGEDNEKEEFYKLETDVMMKALAALEKDGKARVFYSSGDEAGVKFFTV